MRRILFMVDFDVTGLLQRWPPSWVRIPSGLSAAIAAPQLSPEFVFAAPAGNLWQNLHPAESLPRGTIYRTVETVALESRGAEAIPASGVEFHRCATCTSITPRDVVSTARKRRLILEERR